MISLSLGLAYVHYGLKRQSTNRQYLLLQGQAFLSRYLDAPGPDEGKSREGGSSWRAERFYNLGRLFHLLGIGHLASVYYGKALELCEFGPMEPRRANPAGGAETDDCRNIQVCAAVNSFMMLVAADNQAAAYHLLQRHLRL